MLLDILPLIITHVCILAINVLYEQAIRNYLLSLCSWNHINTVSSIYIYMYMYVCIMSGLLVAFHQHSSSRSHGTAFHAGL